MVLTDLVIVVPELFIAAMAMLLLVAGVFRNDKFASFVTKAALLVVVLTAILVLRVQDIAVSGFGGMFINDPFATFSKLIILIATGLTLWLAQEVMDHIKRFEFAVLILLSVAGMMVMVSSNHLMVLYMGLELQSLSLYILASFMRDDARSSEAGMKYFILGALASGLLLYGCGLIYGFTGTLSFTELSQLDELNAGALVGLTLVMIALAFKLSVAPFHMWTPDVYEGAPTIVTAFFSVAPKAAALALMLRVFYGAFGNLGDIWQQTVILLSIVSMLVGAFAALKQTNIKRLMAYSSIGHVGYMLLGMATLSSAGIQASLVYVSIYIVTSIGVFACILLMRRKGEYVENIEDLSGIAKSHPIYAFALSALMFSMAGIPPLAGFFGKFFIFKEVIAVGLLLPAIIGVLASVVAAYYYIRIIKVMYFDTSEKPLVIEMNTRMAAILFVVTLFNIGFILYPELILEPTRHAARTLLF